MFRIWIFGTTVGASSVDHLADRGKIAEAFVHEVAKVLVLEIADGRDDQIARRVSVSEVVAKPPLSKRLDGLLRAEDRAAERMILPESLREDFVDEIVRRVLHHLDLFEDDFLLALDVLGVERRIPDDIGEDVERQRQVLVEHLDVIAGVFLGGKRVELPADRVDSLRDILGRARARSLEQHVLHEMRNAAALGVFVSRPACQPHADADRTNLRHPLRQDAEAVIEHVSDNR